MNAHRVVEGILTGYDPLLNIVIESSYEKLNDGSQRFVGEMVCFFLIFCFFFYINFQLFYLF